MKIRIVPAIGGGSPIELEVSPNTTIGAIRAKVCAMKKLPPDTTRLTYRGRALKDTETLESIGAQDGDKLILMGNVSADNLCRASKEEIIDCLLYTSPSPRD